MYGQIHIQIKNEVQTAHKRGIVTMSHSVTGTHLGLGKNMLDATAVVCFSDSNMTYDSFLHM